MDNRLISQIKRGLKVTSSYGLTLILLLVFVMPILGLAKDSTPIVMIFFSLLLFLILFYSAYVEMRETAIKEKRPQYNINPPPFKGFLYGIIGVIPYIILQIVCMFISIPKVPDTVFRRVYQGLNGPLYWFSKLIGNAPVHYIISFVLVVIIAGVGYYAGYNNFYLVAFIRKKLGIKPKVRKRPEPVRKR